MNRRPEVILVLALFVFSIPLFAQESAPTETQQVQEAEPAQAAPAEAQPAAAAPSASIESAMRSYRRRNYSAAVAQFEQIVAAEPNNAAAHYFMGYAHYVMKHHDQALDHFGKAFQADPAFDPRPYFRR